LQRLIAGVLSVVTIRLAIIAATSVGSTLAVAEGNPPVINPASASTCAVDLQKFCPDLASSKESGEITACLDKREAELSPNCKSARANQSTVNEIKPPDATSKTN
jgi:hypothetical protein